MSKNRSKTNEPRVCLTEDQKIAIARWILLHKNVLFGKHSYAAGITNASKKLKWQEIHDQAVAAGFPVRDANHTRETVWDNMKRSTMEKFKKTGRTGEGGSCCLTALDEAVLDVLGRDSTYLKGIDVPKDAPVLPALQGSRISQRNDSDQILSFPGTSGTSAGSNPLRQSVAFAVPNEAVSNTEEEIIPELDVESAPTTPSVKSFTDEKRRRKFTSGDSIWADETFKRLRIQVMETDLEEKRLKIELAKEEEKRKNEESKARIELMKAQVEESKMKTDLMRAQMKLTDYQFQKLSEENIWISNLN